MVRSYRRRIHLFVGICANVVSYVKPFDFSIYKRIFLEFSLKRKTVVLFLIANVAIWSNSRLHLFRWVRFSDLAMRVNEENLPNETNLKSLFASLLKHFCLLNSKFLCNNYPADRTVSLMEEHDSGLVDLFSRYFRRIQLLLSSCFELLESS